MRIHTNSQTVDKLVDMRSTSDHEHDLHDAFIDRFMMGEVSEQRKALLDLMSMADMCDPEEEKTI